MENFQFMLLVLLVIFIFCDQIIVHSQVSFEYVRPPPRSIIATPDDHPESHPQQVHVSLVGRDHMRVSWVTDDKDVSPKVEYGKIPGKYEVSVTGEHTSYRYFFYKSGKIHHVKIGPLESDVTYYYRCGGVGKEFSFRTPPLSFPIEFAVADYDVLLLPGDLSYADTQQPLWDTFGRFVEPYASRRPWMVTQGNHEVEAFPVIHTHPFVAYNSRWLMPFEESGSNSNLYYSFDVTGVHVIMLGSYADFDAGSAQYKWLVADLARVNREKTPWLVVLLHAPWYNTNTAHQGEGESMRKAMEHLLYNARVDLVFAGHVHSYERFTRVFDNEPNSCGPVHVTIGDGGNREGLAMMFKKPTPPISLFHEASFGHGRLRVLNQTHAHWSWHRNDDYDSTVGDEIWLESLSSIQQCKETLQDREQPKSSNFEL
ncbi:hypothetical protein IFM89_036526 [Coptis chinensis]|uniref:Purple acid phosphatase n=1 Tax=Coptis chinensis TaxID=261450 RepID=A0A835HB75_9MAGN|nr:hypothetical protein IFM89_036526 [Coptis chinensis]